MDISRKKKRSGTKGSQRRALGRDAWLTAARQALIEEGTAGLEVNKLAKRLGVTRGGFYWFFKSQKQLIDELLAAWEAASVSQFERVLNEHPGDGRREFLDLVRLWIDEDEFEPRWDGAVRDWARTSPAVFSAVRRVDDQRIKIIEQIFLNLGIEGQEAHIRARVTYYHQVGYYAMGVRESHKQRLRLMPFYTKVLTGMEL